MLFVHGNVSSSLFWQPTMLALPERYRPIAMDLRGFGDTDPAPVDATRGVRDYSDDVAALSTRSSLRRSTWSAGAWAAASSCSTCSTRRERLASLTLVDPVSPFGFGGTGGVDGTLLDPPAPAPAAAAPTRSSSQRLAAGDRGADSPLSPRQVLLAHYVKPPFVPEHAGHLRRVDAVHPDRRRSLPRHVHRRRRLAGHRARRPRAC